MPSPPRRPDDRRARPDDRRAKPGDRDPYLSGMILNAEVLDAEVLDADVLDAEVLDGASVDAVIEAEVLDAEPIDVEPLPLDDGPADDPGPSFDLELVDGSPLAPTTQAPVVPVYQVVPPAEEPTGAELLSLDADPPRPAARTASRTATATRPAVRITFVCPGEQSPLGGRG